MIRVPGYRLLSRVASGASGTVYRAEQTDLARVVALKLLRPGLFGEEETRARFEREARLQASLSHPYLVAVYDAGFANGQPYLVTEFVDGGSLRDRLDRPPLLPVAEAARLGAEMAMGLACAHEAGIVHRDLKPENVLLTSEGTAKLADFGLARTGARGSQTLQTADGVILGTPGYLAPELLEAGQPTAASDLYALGVILFEMLAGRRPHAREEPIEELRAAARDEPPLVGEFRSGVPSGFAAAIRDCLCRAPGDRPGGAAALAVRIAPFASSEPAGATVAGRTLRLEVAVPAANRGRPGQETRRNPLDRPASSGPGTRRARRTVPAAMAAMAALAGLAAILTLALPGRPRAGLQTSALSPAAGVAVVPPAPLAPPRCTAGATELALRLAPGESRRLELTWWNRATPLHRSSTQFRPVAGAFELDGLEADTRYAAELSVAGAAPAPSCKLVFSTLAREGSSSLLWLTPARTSPQFPVVAASGDSVLAAWWEGDTKADDCALVSRASSDGGTTWSEPERVATTSGWISPVALTQAGDGFQLAWFDALSKRVAGTYTSFHGADRPGWSRPAFIAPGRPLDRASLLFPHGVAMLEGPDPAQLELVTCIGGGKPWPHGLGLTRFGAGGGRVPPLVPLAEIVEDDGATRLARVGKRLHILERFRPDGNASDTIRWTWVEDEGGVKPGGFEQVTGAGENVDSAPSVAALNGRLALAYQSSGLLYCRVLAPGASRFSKPVRVTQTSNDGLLFRETSPSMVSTGGRLLMVHLDGNPLSQDWRLHVAESPDGETWTRRRSQPLPRNLMTDAGAAATSTALVAVVRYQERGVLFARYPLDSLEPR